MNRRITNTIEISEEAGVRYLHFGSSWVQGAMRIARPWELELQYTREMMAALLLRWEPDWPQNVLLIGLGAASLPKFLHRHLPQARLTVVEISPLVVDTARQYFRLPDDPSRIEIVIGDGAQYVAHTRRRFDLVMVDGFDADARAGALDTLPFYQLCRARLTTEGMLVANLLSRSRGFRASTERLERAFDGRVLVFPSCDSGNAIAFAIDGERVRVPLSELKERARELRTATGLDLLPAVARLAQWHACKGGELVL